MPGFCWIQDPIEDGKNSQSPVAEILIAENI
jgi:hypothetical protein